MEQDTQIKYLFINLSRRAYIRLHIGVIAVLLVAAVALLATASGSDFWWLKHAWWICLGAAALDALEAWLALRLAAKPRGATRGAGG